MAEALGMTVAELMTGQKQPLTSQEFMEWVSFWRVRESKREHARKQQESSQKLRQSRGR